MTLHQLFAEWAKWFWPALANHLWQATLVAVVAWVAAILLSKRSARARSVVWLIAILKFVLPSVLLLWLLGSGGDGSARHVAEKTGPSLASALRASPIADSGVRVIFKIAQPLPAMAAQPPPDAEMRHDEIYCALTILWLLGAIGLFTRWMVRRSRFARDLREGRLLTEGRELETLNRARFRLRMSSEVGLIESDRAHEPGVWGLRRPIIVMPARLAERLSDEELEAVMMHELTHVQHRDNLYGSLRMLLCCLFWFHPLIWLIDRWALQEQEAMCDEKVIKLIGEPRTYIESLWKVVRFSLGWPVAGISRATGSDLRRRIKYMLSSDIRINHRPRHRIAEGAVVSCLAVAALTLAFLTGDGAVAQENQVNAVKGKGWDGAAVNSPPPEWERLLSATPDRKIRFENAAGSPIVITEANVKVMKFDSFYALNARITMEGAIERAVQNARIQCWNQRSGKAMNTETGYLNVRRGQAASLNKVWFIAPENPSLLPALLEDYENQLVVKITGVSFMDELPAEKLARKLNPSLSYMTKVSTGLPDGVEPVHLAPAFKMKFENIPGAPVAITNAGVKIGELWQVAANNVRTMFQLNSSLTNQTDRRVTSCIFEIKHPELSMGRGIALGPIGEILVEPLEPRVSVVPYASHLNVIGGAKKMADLPGNFSVRIIGVGFEDGSYWYAAGESSVTGDLRTQQAFFAKATTTDKGQPEAQDLARDVVDKSEVSSLPRVLHSPRPPYTDAARNNGASGTVILSVVFLGNAKIGDVKVIQSLPDGLTDQAIEAAKRISFEPAMKNGRAVSVRGNVEYQFTIDPQSKP